MPYFDVIAFKKTVKLTKYQSINNKIDFKVIF